MPVTPLSKKRVLYSDFPKSMDRHPFSNDLVRKTNEDAVKESIKNIILTDKFERPFRPNFGGNIRSLLFSNYGPETSFLVEREIRSALEAYEPRCEVINVDITPSGQDLDQRTVDDRIAEFYKIEITFSTINIIEPIQLEVILKRIR